MKNILVDEETREMTPGAREALRRAGFSRRDLLKGSGALIVGFSLFGLEGLLGEAKAQVAAPGFPGGFQGGVSALSPRLNQLDSWLAIAADGGVTAYSGKEELGQGIVQAQMQLVAEELAVPLNRVKLLYCDTAMTPDQAYTAGSQSHPTNFNKNNLAQACATAREAFVRMASERLGIPAEQLEAKDGTISAKDDPSKKVTYGDLVGGKKFNLTLDAKAKRKPASEWTVLGKPLPRWDMPALATGQFEFVQNVRVPDMLHGRVVRPPVIGAPVMNVDESSVAGMPGNVKVVVKKDFVGVVADKPWQAIQAAAKLKVTWGTGTGLPKQAEIYDHLRNQKPVRDTLLIDSTDVEQALAGAATVVKASYHHPYQMHGAMASSCAVADVQGDKATVWSATQAVYFLQNTMSMVLGLKPENVHVIFTRGSGCYGLNGVDTVSYDAAVLSQAVGKPVRVQLTRKDEMAWENFGQAQVMDERVGLDAQGNIVAWDYEHWVPTYGGRPGTQSPGNVITGMLLGFKPDPFVPRVPAPPPANYNNNSNGIPSYVAGCVKGMCKGKGTVKAERAMMHTVESPLLTAQLRSPQRLQNTFAHECFMDELAAQVKADAVEYRLRHLTDPRLADVLTTAAKKANWDARPSPKAHTGGLATGRGIACVDYEGDNGYSGLVAEVEVNMETGGVRVTSLTCAVDCGPISNPDGLRNQTEGGALQGMSRALMEEATWDDDKITSINWTSYRVLPLGFDLPKVDVELINRPDEEATGAGELSITVVAAAIGNAIFDATGARIRELPFTPQRVKAAMSNLSYVVSPSNNA